MPSAATGAAIVDARWSCRPRRSSRSRTCSTKDDAGCCSTRRTTDDGTRSPRSPRLLSRLFVADDAPAFVARPGRPLGTGRRAGALGRGPLPGRRPAARRRAQRRQARRRARPCRCDCSVGRVAGARRRRQHLVDRACSTTRQAHRRRLQGPARGRPALHRDHRQRGGAPPRGRRARAAAARTEAQPLAKQSLRFLYRILFLLYAEASPELASCRSGAPEYDAGLQPRPAPRPDPRRAGHTAARRTGTHLYESLPCCSGWSTSGHAAGRTDGRRRRPAPRAGRSTPLRADLFRPEATALIDEVGLGNARTPAGAAAPAAEQGAKGARTAASSPTPSSASTSSARSTRA